MSLEVAYVSKRVGTVINDSLRKLEVQHCVQDIYVFRRWRVGRPNKTCMSDMYALLIG